MKNKDLEIPINSIIEDTNYIELNQLKVSVNKEFFILDFKKNENGKLKEKIKLKYYDSQYNLSDKILISEAIFKDGELITEGRFDDVFYIKKLKNYNPFINENIFTDTYYIDLEDDNSILNFVNNYGLIGSDYKYKSNLYKEQFVMPKTLFTGQYRIKPVIEDLQSFKSSIRNFKAAVNLWNEINKNNINYETIYHLWNEYIADEYFKKIDVKQYFKKLAKKSINKTTEFLTFCIFDNQLKEISPILRPAANNNYKAGYTSSTILSVIFFQLYKMILNNENTYKCDYCKRLNTYTSYSKNDRFCTKDNNFIHSICNNKYNYMKNKTINKIIENNMTFNQIEKIAKNINWTNYEGSKKKGRELKEVLIWINEYNPKSNIKIKAFEEYKRTNKNVFIEIKKRLNKLQPDN